MAAGADTTILDKQNNRSSAYFVQKPPMHGFLTVSLNPCVLYQEAVTLYKNRKYLEAVKKLNQAIQIAEEKPNLTFNASICYSTLASCHRELKQYSLAAEACRKAFTSHGDLGRESLHKKYLDILQLEMAMPNLVYNAGVQYFKENQFELARCNILYCIERFKASSDPNKNQIATCYSTLGSCLNQLALPEEALAALDNALKYCMDTTLKERIEQKLIKYQESRISPHY